MVSDAPFFASFVACHPLLLVTRRMPQPFHLLLVTLLLGMGYMAIRGVNNSPLVGILPFTSDLIPLSASFNLAGYYPSNTVRNMKFNLLTFMSALTNFTALHGTFDQSMDLNQRLFDHPLIVAGEATLGIYLTLPASSPLQHIPNASSILSILGSNSLFLLIFH